MSDAGVVEVVEGTRAARRVAGEMLAPDRVRQYWTRTAELMGISLFLASMLCVLAAVLWSSPASSATTRVGAQDVLSTLVTEGRTFGLGALAILCGLLLPLYLGFTGLGSVTEEGMHEALAVQDVREDLIFFLAFGGAITGWFLLPVAVTTLVLAVPLIIVVGTLCCLAALREETASQGMMGELRAQRAKRGLYLLMLNLGADPYAKDSLEESLWRRARWHEILRHTGCGLAGYVALGLLFHSSDVPHAWSTSLLLAAYFSIYIAVRTAMSRNGRIKRARKRENDTPLRRFRKRLHGAEATGAEENSWSGETSAPDETLVTTRKSGQEFSFRAVGAGVLDVVIVLTWASMITILTASYWKGAATALAMLAGVFYLQWWAPRETDAYRLLLIRAAYKRWLGGPFARRGSDDPLETTPDVTTPAKKPPSPTPSGSRQP